MVITHEEQAWLLDGLRVIMRRAEFHAQDCAAVGCDPRAIRRSGDALRRCRRLLDKLENLAFDEDGA